MNIFIIPSWYPHSAQPIAGCFTQEQARYYAELYRTDRMIVSVVGIGDFSLSLRQPQTCIGNLIRYFKAPRFHEEAKDNFIEWHRPVLDWSPRMGGNLTGITTAHLKNFLHAKKHFGPMDVIHAHVTYPAGWVAMKLSQRSGVPYVITEHMSPFPFPISKFIHNNQLTHWIRAPLEAAHKVVAVSSTLADRMASFGLQRPQVIPNVVDERCFTPGNDTKTNRPFTFLTVGGMVAQKGIPDLLKAAALVLKADGNIRCRFAGDGPQAGTYRHLARELEVDHAVE